MVKRLSPAAELAGALEKFSGESEWRFATRETHRERGDCEPGWVDRANRENVDDELLRCAWVNQLLCSKIST